MDITVLSTIKCLLKSIAERCLEWYTTVNSQRRYLPISSQPAHAPQTTRPQFWTWCQPVAWWTALVTVCGERGRVNRSGSRAPPIAPCTKRPAQHVRWRKLGWKALGRESNHESGPDNHASGHYSTASPSARIYHWKIHTFSVWIPICMLSVIVTLHIGLDATQTLNQIMQLDRL